MAKYEIKMVIQFEALDIEEAETHYEDLCDIMGESGFESVEAEIGPAIENNY